jgi:hypothetical protein
MAGDLRAQYDGAQDEDILRIVDTLHVYRFDWMENASKALQELCDRIPQNLHATILNEAQEIAVDRLKHIGFMQISGEYLDILEHDKIAEGQDRFPELFDGSTEAEEVTLAAINEIALLRQKISTPLVVNDNAMDRGLPRSVKGPK